MSIRRFSSRTTASLGKSFIADRLTGAKAYDRIAGFFSSSILEIAGEQIEAMGGKVRIVCNSQLDPDDVKSARAANLAMRREWCASDPEQYSDTGKERFRRLYDFLVEGRMQVKVLPDHRFGLIHGKAGVITMKDGSQTSFLGSVNESKTAWEINHELMWEDDSPEAVAWVQEEFDTLWQCHEAYPLAEAIIQDIERTSSRTVISTVKKWKGLKDPDPASPIIETPVYRREYGLWAHQKYFVKKAFDAHRTPMGARFVLADMVGLGKTMQLAMSALLMSLYGSKPVLIIAPKPLLLQWQDEMKRLLDMPSAVWNGRQWVDENEIAQPVRGAKGIAKCPRRVGLVSQGLFTAKTEAARYLENLDYECIIVDEAHRARRNNLGKNGEGEKADPNNLLAFLQRISSHTKSMLLATATPVQMYPIEAWDLLDALAIPNEHILGNTVSSNWRRADRCLPIVTGAKGLPTEDLELWSWIRNPLPPAEDDRTFSIVRTSLGMNANNAVASGSDWEKLRAPDQARVHAMRGKFAAHHNPFIRHIVRRTRDFLEKELDPETDLPYLQPVVVKLLGEGSADAIKLTAYLKDAYKKATEFCALVGKRAKSAGFLKTLLLRRVGSSIISGMNTAKMMLENWEDVEDDETSEEGPVQRDEFRSLSPGERGLLEEFVNILEANQSTDPKYEAVARLLIHGHPEAGNEGWLHKGCIIFSQYYDSVIWLAERLSRDAASGTLIGIYAGAGKSGLMRSGEFQREDREVLKRMVRDGELSLLIGTDAASEGLNLQRLGTLINLDLPWNPTRLEQRKGRIQRIGQKANVVYVFNMRYRDSVEDRVHQMLSERLGDIHDMFGQVPDTLEDVWIALAIGESEKASKLIGTMPKKHPFAAKYNQIASINWESCAAVLNKTDKREVLMREW
ncbi:MAG: DEAD/DEAH box helicase family protein [Verrucomicrobiae bacterium]|nr:DEAD/DEAH box helicase family protein [Verrucomicrobiae bacterium]